MSDKWVIEVDYSNLSKGQLKELCDQNELNTSGNKEDLLQRLNEMITPSVQETQEKIRVSCPSCSKTLMFPSDHPAELRCPACSNVFDPRVSSFVSKHGVEIKLQGTGDRRDLCSLFLLFTGRCLFLVGVEAWMHLGGLKIVFCVYYAFLPTFHSLGWHRALEKRKLHGEVLWW